MVVDLTPKPKLRSNIEIMPVGDGNFIIRDIGGYIDETLVVNHVSAIVISMFDGKRSPSEISKIVSSMVGTEITESEIKKVVDALDKHGFLDSPSFSLLRAKKKSEFRAISEKPSRFAGKSFPAGGKEAEEFFSSILELFPSEEKDENLFAIVSPHIEISNGMKIYGKAWNFIRNSLKKPDLFFIFGTSHAYSEYPLILTDKDFQTPFGTLKTDKDIVKSMVEVLGNDCFEDEIIHKAEHSVEFQAVFIKYLFPTARIVPILCSSSWLYKPQGRRIYDEILERLHQKVIGSLKNFVLVAGADFAHVGVRFGDNPVNQYDVSIVRLKDFISLQKFAENSQDGFLDSIMFDQNERKVCGVSPIYTVLGLSRNYKTRGKILGWDIWVDETLSAVSFGSAYLARA